ncbi:hypothetical protein Btru_066170 [Bulinus truncatus]|nr:hypothetical protein Btru_066170 [Bulinus truncatus]
MLEEGCGAMEKKLPSRQSPVQHKNNGVICDKKSDYVSNKNGLLEKREPNENGEEITEAGDVFDEKYLFPKGHANHLLKFFIHFNSQNGNYGGWRAGSGRSGGRGQGYYRRTPVIRYSKEQFLQASCQFVVRMTASTLNKQ